jgi:phage gp29-like protein
MANDGQLFDKLRERAGEEMALAVLGQTFTGGGGEGHALGYSGQAHEAVRFDLVDSDAKGLDETLNRQFFGPITLLNFGPDVPPPVYRTLVEEPVDLQRLATSVSTLVSVGLRVPARWARKKFGIPAPDDREEVLAPPAVRAPGQPADSLAPADPADRSDRTDRTPIDGKAGG